MANHPPAHGEPVAGTVADAGGSHGPEPTAFGLDAPAWVALSMLVVFAIFLWKRVPAAIGKALDGKIATIRAQLAEAAQLRADAEALKAEYEAKAAAAEGDRALIIERARDEAHGIIDQARADSEALIERRARMAEDKIGAAERHALEEVRARAASAAAAAAARLIAEDMEAGTDKALVDRTIQTLSQTH